MSNVLIGIIGVILFIGLALAGALFLGPRFQQATSTSQAAASMQALTQVAYAVDMYNVDAGARYPAQTRTIGLPAAYLKAVTLSPSKNFDLIDIRSDAGTYDGDGDWANMGGFGGPAAKECAEIARNSGMTLDADGGAPKASRPYGARGCIRLNGTWGSVSSDGSLVIAYARI